MGGRDFAREIDMKMKLIVFALMVLCGAAGAAEARGYGHHGYRHGGHHYNYRHHDGAYWPSLVGGIVLGTLLAPPRYVAATPPVVYVSQPAPVVVTNPPPVASTGRRLLRDSNGNCFERRLDASGREVSVSLSPAECLW
tara:strand:- start:2456 stop:2872 length:417 start_codon:yes stop_codon:yes gene_type:complete